jgi:hypothetical protein
VWWFDASSFVYKSSRRVNSAVIRSTAWSDDTGIATILDVGDVSINGGGGGGNGGLIKWWSLKEIYSKIKLFFYFRKLILLRCSLH